MFGGATARRGAAPRLPSYGGLDPYDYGTYGKTAKRPGGGGGGALWAVGLVLVVALAALGVALHSTRGQLAQMHEHVSIMEQHLLNEKVRRAMGAVIRRCGAGARRARARWRRRARAVPACCERVVGCLSG
jgi:hypothetical protein